jgi:alkylhydroperoxidase family enzyme
MIAYPIHTLDSAPPASKPALEGLQKGLGRIPNLAATMAASPTLITAFVGAWQVFGGGTFSNAERQVLLLTNAVTNRAAWAVAFHSTIAEKEGVDVASVRAIREGRLPDDRRLAALSNLTRMLIEKRGHLEAKDVDGFVTSGFSAAQVFEVISGLAVSTMANYASNIAKPVVEEPFRDREWNAG